MVKMTGSMSIRLTADEIEACEMLRIKGIPMTHIFRRGLDAYLTDFTRSASVTAHSTGAEETDKIQLTS